MISGAMGVYTLECDICGEDSGETFDCFEDALQFKKDPANQWKSKRIDGQWYDCCPKCREG